MLHKGKAQLQASFPVRQQVLLYNVVTVTQPSTRVNLESFCVCRNNIMQNSFCYVFFCPNWNIG